MVVYSYVVTGRGLPAPARPDLCALTCCKPLIRERAVVGDLVIGMASRSAAIVYALRVTEKAPRGADLHDDALTVDACRARRHERPEGGTGPALLSREFVVLGAGGPPLGSLGFLAVGRGHRCRFTDEQVAAVERWFAAVRRR